MLILSVLLLIVVLVFSFLVLIPEGKKYREKRAELNKQKVEFKRYDDFSKTILDKLKKLQSDNRHTITALSNEFNEDRFIKLHKKHFLSLNIQPKKKLSKEDEFLVYEVNTTSSIDSPKSFYNFLDALNRSDWVIGVNFPIDFKRDSKIIKSSFTMKVYKVK
jgi:hypothetical protein